MKPWKSLALCDLQEEESTCVVDDVIFPYIDMCLNVERPKVGFFSRTPLGLQPLRDSGVL